MQFIHKNCHVVHKCEIAQRVKHAKNEQRVDISAVLKGGGGGGGRMQSSGPLYKFQFLPT